jgi:glucose-1-phosphate cytidylyltransferase
LADRKSHEDWMIDLVDTGTTSMTGGRLRRLRHLLDDTFIFTYGDGLSNIRIDELVRFHRDHGKLATVTAVRPPPRFGVLRLAGDRVTTFNEKTDYPGTLVNGGYFVLEPGVIDFIEDDQTIWERGPCERLANEGQLMAYPHHDYWQCVDTLHELRMLRETWDSGNAPWKVWK